MVTRRGVAAERRSWSCDECRDGSGAAGALDRSLAQAFVQFLETESKPKQVLRLPVPAPSDMTPPAGDRLSNRSTPVSEHSAAGGVVRNPILMSPLPGGGSTELPTFAMNRSSSAILKNVLHGAPADPVPTSPPSAAPPPSQWNPKSSSTPTPTPSSSSSSSSSGQTAAAAAAAVNNGPSGTH